MDCIRTNDRYVRYKDTDEDNLQPTEEASHWKTVVYPHRAGNFKSECKSWKTPQFMGIVRCETRGQDYKEKHKLDSNKSQTHRAKQYEVMSFLSTDCELSTETCSKNVYSIGPSRQYYKHVILCVSTLAGYGKQSAETLNQQRSKPNSQCVVWMDRRESPTRMRQSQD